MGLSSLSWVYRRKLLPYVKYMASRKALPMYKASLAYLIAYILIFLRGFDKLDEFPNTLSSMIILVIIGNPGKAVGACVQSTMLGLLGVCLGAVGFVVLGELHGAPVAQGFVFAGIVYLAALVKAAKGIKYFPLILLAVILSFNGIYTSILVGSYSSAYLAAYIKTYCWAAAIVLTVNLVVFPSSSEKELRRTLFLSIEHIAVFSHLLAKNYTLELTDEERQARDHLAQSIRADFGFLMQKIEETSIEVNYSRFSMRDYQDFVSRTRGMQLALITVYSSLKNFEEKDLDLFKQRFLPSTIKSFSRLRASLHQTMTEIGAHLGCRPFDIPSTQPGYNEFLDIERQVSHDSSETRSVSSGPLNDVDERLNLVSRRLAEEFGAQEAGAKGEGVPPGRPARREQDAELKTPTTPTVVPSIGDHTNAQSRNSLAVPPADVSRSARPASRPGTSGTVGTTGTSSTVTGRCIRSLRRIFDKFASDQNDILTEMLVSGKLYGGDDSLRIADQLPSLRDMYNYRYVPVSDDREGDGTETPGGNDARKRDRRDRRAWTRWRRAKSEAGTPVEKEDDIYYEVFRERTAMEKRMDDLALASNHSMTHVYSFLFGMSQFVNELEALYYAATSKTQRRVHVHLWERLYRPHNAHCVPATSPPTASASSKLESQPKDCPQGAAEQEPIDPDISVAEAISLLERRPYTPPHVKLVARLEKFELWLRGTNSIFAAKTAAAATIFAVLILHPVPRPWFISFGVNGGILTVVTALNTTLGQSILGFTLQVAGTGVGYVWALILLEVFKDVGGYHFNPYGITALLVPFALILSYILCEIPRLIVFAILALNGAGVVLVVEYTNVQYLGNTSFDSPPLRFAKAFTSLGVALALSGIFQLVVLRNPARRTLRKRIGAMLYDQLSYATLLQAYLRGAIPTTKPSLRAPEAALRRVERELRKRELRLQAELIALRPIVGFAAAEPQLSRPFKLTEINRLLRTSQVVLDRMREARTAIGIAPFPDDVITNFSVHLAPYRKRNTQYIQLSFYLIASSVLAKAALPSEPPAELETGRQLANFTHDALVLAARQAKTEEGRNMLRSGDFVRYFHYLVSITSILGHLALMEDICKDVFGVLDDKLA